MIKIKSKFIKYFILFFLILFLSNCGSNDSISVSEYLAWFNKKDCPIIKKQLEDGYSYELRYLTADCLALKEIPKEALTNKKLKEELKARAGLYYFLLRIVPTEEKKQIFVENESKSISWLSFGLKEEIKVIQGKDTLKCVMNQFEPSMGIMPFQSFNIGIIKPENSNEKDPKTDIKLLFYDKVNNDKQIVFTIKASDFKQIPNYKL